MEVQGSKVRFQQTWSENMCDLKVNFMLCLSEEMISESLSLFVSCYWETSGCHSSGHNHPHKQLPVAREIAAYHSVYSLEFFFFFFSG